MKIIFTIKLKKYVIYTDIFGIIVNKLYYRKNLYLIILFKVDKNLKKTFYCAFLLLSLAIRLRTEDN